MATLDGVQFNRGIQFIDGLLSDLEVQQLLQKEDIKRTFKSIQNTCTHEEILKIYRENAMMLRKEIDDLAERIVEKHRELQNLEMELESFGRNEEKEGQLQKQLALKQTEVLHLLHTEGFMEQSIFYLQSVVLRLESASNLSDVIRLPQLELETEDIQKQFQAVKSGVKEWTILIVEDERRCLKIQEQSIINEKRELKKQMERTIEILEDNRYMQKKKNIIEKEKRELKKQMERFIKMLEDNRSMQKKKKVIEKEKRKHRKQMRYLNEQNQKQSLKKKNEELKQKEEEIEKLHCESRTRELLAKSTGEMLELCIKNEDTICNAIDNLQEQITKTEDEKRSLEDRLYQTEATIIDLKKQKEVMEENLTTVKETVMLLDQKSAPMFDVTSETSQPLKQLIEKNVRLEQNFKKTEKELEVHNDENLGENSRNHEDGDDSGARAFPDDNTQRAIAGVLDPQNISELYKNLYDNHWRDAFKVANHVYHDAKERTKVKRVLNMFEKAFAFCKDAFDQQKLGFIDKLKEGSSVAIRPDEARVVQQMRNGTTSFFLSFIYQSFQNTRLDRYGQSLTDEYPIFLQESIRICWLMNLHDPPVVLKENIKSGDEFNPEFYAKQHDGDNTVDFVVLPTLMLNNGSIIAKGVVQCKQIKREQSKGILIKKKASMK